MSACDVGGQLTGCQAKGSQAYVILATKMDDIEQMTKGPAEHVDEISCDTAYKSTPIWNQDHCDRWTKVGYSC